MQCGLSTIAELVLLVLVNLGSNLILLAGYCSAVGYIGDLIEFGCLKEDRGEHDHPPPEVARLQCLNAIFVDNASSSYGQERL